MKKIAFVLACILTISICLAGCQETEFDTGEGTPVFSLDANEISAVTFQNGNTGEKTIVSNRDEITEIADYLNAFRYTETQSVRGGDGWSSRIIIDCSMIRQAPAEVVGRLLSSLPLHRMGTISVSSTKIKQIRMLGYIYIELTRVAEIM